jgi:hypothetical protein
MERANLFQETSFSLDEAWSVLEALRQVGAVVVVKLDGQRKVDKQHAGSDEASPYVVVINAGGLGDEYVHVEAKTLASALKRALLDYYEAVLHDSAV